MVQMTPMVPTTGWLSYRRSKLDDRIGALLQPDIRSSKSHRFGLFDDLTDEQAEEIMAHGNRKVLSRGAKLFSQNTPHDGLFFIESGRARVFYTAPSGREITLAIWHSGNFVGGPEVFGGGMHVWSGVAASNISVVHFPGAALRSLALKIPSFAIALIKCLSFKGACYSAMAQMLGTRSVTERLAYLLLHLTDLYGVPTEDGLLIASRFTHEDIAHLVGATRQWVTISLRRFNERGVLKVQRSGITIRQPEVLTRIRDGGSSEF
jgi:CRP/FNR family cyclic AMP-dependent transcriptional regulator